MKKTPILPLLLVIVLLFSALVLPASAQETVSSGCHSLNARIPLDSSGKKLDTAKAVILYEMNTDSLVYAYNPDQQINPTGLVKLLTALVAIEQGNLDDMVTVYRSTLDTVAIGAVSAGLKAGEELSLRDLLYCVMVSSANDAAAVIAAHVGGSQSAFVEMMNARAKELGCTASNFANPHGLNDPNQYSTARDLAIITEAALENNIFRSMFSAKSYTVGATNLSAERHLNTTNYMMSESYIRSEYDARVTGGKPAAQTTTNRSMICTAEVGSARYLCVVMNVKGEVSADGLSVVRYGIFEETSKLLDFGFQNFSVRQVLDDAETLYQYPVSGGENDVVLRPSQDLFVVLPNGFDPQDLHYTNVMDGSILSAPVAAGQRLGNLQISYRNILVGSCDLLTMHAVEPDGATILPAERIDPEEPEKGFDWTNLLIYAGLALFVLLVLAILVIVVIRAVRSAKIRRQQRRRARKRKRSRK